MIWDFGSLKSSFIFYLLWSSFALLLLKYEKVSAFFEYKVVMYGVRVVRLLLAKYEKAGHGIIPPL